MLSQSSSQPMVLKVAFTGDVGVGKTSLLRRETQDTFTKEFLATIGVDFHVKCYDFGIMKVKAQLWDTAGQERFRSIQKPYFRNAKGVCLCFSLNDRTSFDNIPRAITDLEEHEVSRDNIFLIGCKSDLQIVVPTDQILVFAQRHNLPYYQTSAKESEGVNEAFRSIITIITQREIAAFKPSKGAGDKIKNPEQANPVKKGCC